MRIIMKFGGTSVGDGLRIRHAARLVKEGSAGREVVVVTSAMSGVTDELLGMARRVVEEGPQHVDALVESLRDRHLTALKDAVRDEGLKASCSVRIEELLSNLGKVLFGVGILRELTPRSMDHILAFGERLLAPIFSTSLEDQGVKSEDMSGGEAGIVTDATFGEANPLMEVTRMRLKGRLEPLLQKGIVPVITGFEGVTQDGEVTTLGRGGSDYSATIMAVGLEADEVWIWSDVDGFMTCDPKVVPTAKLIPQVSYLEAMEMVAFGAKAMHPKALIPVAERGIPLRVKNTFKPEEQGTLITSGEPEADRVVKAIGIMKDLAMIRVSGAQMVGRPGTAAKIFDVLGRSGVNILMISQSITEANISMIVKRSQAQRALSSLEIALLGGGWVKEVSSTEGVGVLSVIGPALRQTPGIAARAFKSVADKGINILMIAQGSSEMNLSLVLDEKDLDEAARAVHREFGLDSQ